MDTQEAPKDVLMIPVSKTGTSLEVNLKEIPDDAYRTILIEGLKAILAKKMSKITVAKLEGEQLAAAQAAALEIAKSNLKDVYEDKVKSGRGSAKSKGVPGVVMTEARRIAKAVVKDAIRAAGQKISHVEASVITAAANQLIADDPSYVEKAKANIEARSQVVPADKEAAQAMLVKLGGVKESSKLVAKAAAKKAEANKDAPLSAKQAGKVAPRKKGDAAPAQMG